MQVAFGMVGMKRRVQEENGSCWNLQTPKAVGQWWLEGTFGCQANPSSCDHSVTGWSGLEETSKIIQFPPLPWAEPPPAGDSSLRCLQSSWLCLLAPHTGSLLLEVVH